VAREVFIQFPNYKNVHVHANLKIPNNNNNRGYKSVGFKGKEQMAT